MNLVALSRDSLATKTNDEVESTLKRHLHVGVSHTRKLQYQCALLVLVSNVNSVIAITLRLFTFVNVRRQF